MSNTLNVDIEPFKKYIDSDKSMYPFANTIINPKTGRNYIDPDNDFRIGKTGGILLNIEFTFINMDLFREAALRYETYKKYTFEEPDSIDYNKFVHREEYRREHGMVAPCKLNKDGSISDLSISGEHYNFINYGWIEKLDREKTIDINAEPSKKWGIPETFDSQYWIFKIKKFARRNGFNLIILKSRRKGMSYIEGVGSANTVNLFPNSRVIHAAYDKKYLIKSGALTNMALIQLNRYEFETPFIRGSIDEKGLPRGLFKKDIEELVTGYRDRYDNAAGDQSVLFTVSTQSNPDAAVGKSAKEVKCDELNTFPNFTEFMKMTNPTTTTGSFKTGIITAFGTGGSKEGNWAEFEKHYFNTGVYDFMPFENVWDENSMDEAIGFFIPYWWGLEGVDDTGKWSIDNNGNTNYDIAMSISDFQRQLQYNIGGYNADYINHVSQYSNRPSEAFNSGTTKFLSSAELRDHIKLVIAGKEYKNYVDGWIEETKNGVKFKSNHDLLNEGKQAFSYIEDVPLKETTNPHGAVRIFKPPFRLQNGDIPGNLYFTVYDPYGVDREAGEITIKHSLATVQVWMYPNNISNSAGKILCATWTGRLNSTEEADIVAINLTKLYNGKLLPEVDRGTTINTAKKLNFLGNILPDPTDVLDNKERGKRSLGIVIGDTYRKLDGIVLLKDLLYERISIDETDHTIFRFNLIHDLPTLKEFDKFSAKGNYDRVSCSILAAYQINAYITSKLKPTGGNTGRRLYDELKKLRTDGNKFNRTN